MIIIYFNGAMFQHISSIFLSY